MTKKQPEVPAPPTMRQAATLADIEKAADKLKDAREEAFRDIVRKLFSYEAINFVARLSQELAYHINKHIIAEIMFVKYWAFFRVDFAVVPSDLPPFWKLKSSDLTDEVGLKAFERTAYRDVIEQTMALTVSLEGKGREEGLGVLNDARRELEVQDAKQGLWSRMTGGGR